MKEEVAGTKILEQNKTRSSRDRHQKKEKPKPLSKVIIRRLPPTMTEEEFLKQIDPLPEHDSYYFSAADWSLGFDATCRAYINFRNHEDVFLFRDRFDGYVFVDSKGEEYPAVVEFAPFQGLPKNKARKSDPKVNTIESEAHYLNFLKKLEEDREAAKNESKLEFSLQPKDEKKITSTPLLQFIMNRKMEKREEQKKRTEDNRRKREEEKQKRRNRISKTIPSAIKEEGTPAKDGKPKPEGTADNPDEKKNSRSKRRAERDQRRQKEHEQRRKEKEKERAAESEQKAIQKAVEPDAIKDPEKAPSATKTSETEQKRKEVKKYSERREKNRSKNSQNPAAPNESESATASNSTTSVAAEKRQVKEDNAMMTFMKNVSNVKEFVPKHKQKLSENPSDKLTVDMEEVKEKLENISLHKNSPSPERDEMNETKSERNERSQRNSSSSGGYVNETKGEDRSDRRIRNKDRPSIAIYQPGKTRLRLSEEGNEVKSNPTSDAESVKKEERPNATRKVSRYSEKRSGRTKDGRRKSGGEEKGLRHLEKSVEKQTSESKRDEEKGEKTVD